MHWTVNHQYNVGIPPGRQGCHPTQVGSSQVVFCLNSPTGLYTVAIDTVTRYTTLLHALAPTKRSCVHAHTRARSGSNEQMKSTRSRRSPSCVQYAHQYNCSFIQATVSQSPAREASCTSLSSRFTGGLTELLTALAHHTQVRPVHLGLAATHDSLTGVGTSRHTGEAFHTRRLGEATVPSGASLRPSADIASSNFMYS